MKSESNIADSPEIARAHEPPRFVTGLSEIAEYYDLFLVDQWGVLHDGVALFPGVADCLQRLKESGKHVVVLSNSGKPAGPNIERLQIMGIDPVCYTTLISSGTVARYQILKGLAPFDNNLGSRGLLLSSDAKTTLFDGSRFVPVEAVDEADFILLAGVQDTLPWSYFEAVMASALAKSLPLVCANPDRVRFSAEGLTFSAGAVAYDYKSRGGEVHFIGKPYPAIYDYCRETIPDYDAAKTVMVGDSLAHDVAGGHAAGLGTLFVADGIHRAEFASAVSGEDFVRCVLRLVEKGYSVPDSIVRNFRW